MKKIFLSLIVIFLISNNLSIAQNKQSKPKVGNLTVIISGLKNNKGDVRIGLFNSEESYKGKKEKFKGAIIEIRNKKVKWEVKNIPLGNYAIKTFHDENQDDDVDTKLGIPSEGFGFSNNPSILFGPPSYKKAKFIFNSDSMKIEIKLNNLL